MTYTFKATHDLSLSFEGGTVVRKAGEPYSTEDPCQMRDFVRTFRATTQEGVAEERGGVIAELNELCKPGGAGAGAPEPAPNEEVVVVAPTETKQPGDDSVQLQGGPDTRASGAVAGDAVEAGVTPRQAVERFWGLGSSSRSRSVEEVVNLVSPPPATPVDFDEVVRRTLRNEPEPGQPHPSHAAALARTPAGDAEPVDLFLGAFTINVVDLVVPTVQVPIVMSRSYRSGRPYFGPLGFGWDHAYNVYLRPLADGGVALWTGQLHERRFRVAGGGFAPEPGYAARLERVAGASDAFEIHLPGGHVWQFGRPVGWKDAERIPLIAINDRHGNAVHLGYGAIDRVTSVLDAAGRGLVFHYGSCELLERVTDHTGVRVVRYDHDADIEHLVRVVLPATAQYPEGVATTYEYDRYASHPAMQHNVLRLHDADGRLMVENEFAGPEAAWGFNAVVRQRFAGFEYAFEYQQVQYVVPDPQYVDVLATRTLVRRPDGSLHIHTFNYRGDLLDYRCRLIRDGSFRVVAAQWQHDAEGNMTQSVGPDGLRKFFIYDSQNLDPCARRNLLRVEIGAPIPGAAPSRVVYRAQYEPRYQLVVTAEDEGGAQTRLVYDFDANPVSSTGRLARIELPAVIGADGAPQQSSLRFEHNTRGQLTATVKPEGGRTELTYVSGGRHDGFLAEIIEDPSGAHLVTTFAYDPAGFPALVTAPGGRVTGFTYNALGQAERMEAPEVDGQTGQVRTWFDDSGAVIRQERPAGAAPDLVHGTSIVDSFERDETGTLRRVILASNTQSARHLLQRVDHEGRPVSLWDPRGTRTERCYGENGALLHETAAVGDSVAQKTTYSHDRAGRVTHVTGPLHEATGIEYDVWGRPHRITLPNGALRTLQFGSNDRLIEDRVEARPAAAGGPRPLLRRQSYEYDRRGRLIATTLSSFREAAVPEVALRTRYLYDRNDNVRAILLPRGAEYRYDFDDVGRLTETKDPLGNVRRSVYDSSDDLTESISIENGAAHATTRSNRHDARGRVTRSEELGTVARFAYDDRDFPVERRAPDGVTTRRKFDALGQVIESVVDPTGAAERSRFEYDPDGKLHRYRDPTGQSTTWQRDALGRVIAVTLPDGATFEFTTDAGAGIIEQRTPSGNRVAYHYSAEHGRPVRMSCAAAPGQDPVAVHELDYDGMGRLVFAAIGTEAIVRRHDSLGRLIEETTRGKTVRMHYDDIAGSTDLVLPDGRRERTEYNPAGQPTRVVLVAAGDLGGTPGETLLDIVYSTAGRPVRMAYGNGVEGQLIHDEQGRVIRIEYRNAGTLLDSCRLRYDEGGHRAVVQYLGAPARNLVHRFDNRERLGEARSGFPLAALPDATGSGAQVADVAAAWTAAAAAPGVAFTLDDAAARTQMSAVNGGGANVTYVLGSDHRVVAVGPTALSYNTDGHRTADQRYRYDLDALNRVRRVRDRATGAVLTELRYDALSRVALETTDGQAFERWFAGATQVHELSGPGNAMRQHSSHPLWPSPFCIVDAAGPAYLHQDEGWSTMCVSDAAGAVVERHRHDVFGASAIFAADGATPLGAPRTEPRWRGMPALGATGLFRTPRRLYDPDTGVFTSRDPLLYHDAASPYAYAGHNPVDFADPTGYAKSALGSPDGAPARSSPHWTTQTEWAYPRPDARLIQPVNSVDTGNTAANFALNKIILPWRNLFAFYENVPLALLIGVDDALEHSPLQVEYHNLAMMAPMEKAMGIAIEAGPAIEYLATWLATLRTNPRIAAAAYTPLSLAMGGLGGGGGSPRVSAAQVAVRGWEDGVVNVPEGRLGFSSYNTAGTVSKAVGFAGADMEAAHVLPQAVGKYIPGYSPGRALTTYLPREAHTTWDRAWIPMWNAAVTNKTPMTAGQVYMMLDNALAMNPGLTAAARQTISWRLHDEMFRELKLLWDTPILP